MISFSHIYYDKHESGFLLLPMIPLFLDHAFIKNILCNWKKIFERELCILKIWVFFGLATQYYLNVIMYTEKKSHSCGKIYKNDVDTFMFKNFDKVCYLSKSYTCLFSC